jgi:SAM-dependent methyltransferase
MYDTFSTDYDRFVNWESRLAYELPFIERMLQPITAGSGRPVGVLDAACGTGRHAIALAQRGYAAAGADLRPMVARGSGECRGGRCGYPFQVTGFGGLAEAFQSAPFFTFDALLCLGNSLPHVVTLEDLASSLADFGACLRPGGPLLIQNRNFDLVVKGRERWMEPQSHVEMGQNGEREWLFLRFYDFERTV